MNIAEQLLNIFHIGKTIKKQETLEGLMNAQNGISSVLIPMVEDVRDSFNRLDLSSHDEKLVLDVFQRAGFKARSIDGALGEVEAFLTKMDEDIDYLTSKVNKHMPKVINNRLLNPRDGAYITVIDTIESTLGFLPDLLLFAVNTVAVSNLPKSKVKSVNENMAAFRIAVNGYKDGLKKIVDEIEDVNAAPIDELNAANYDMSNIRSLINLPTNGFVGSPWYFIGKKIIDFKKSRYDNIKDKKSLAVAMLADLELKRDGKESEELDNAIDYYQELIVEYDRKLAELKEG